MKLRYMRLLIIVCLSHLVVCVFAMEEGIMLQKDILIKARQRVQAGEPQLQAAYKALLAAAELALHIEPPTVTQKKHPAPSGDPHDYVSLLSYAWPNPNSVDGMPWRQRDGKKNPLTKEYDRPRLQAMYTAVRNLGFAWWFSGDKRYEKKAIELLRVFFLNQDTRMNPHLRYAQFFPGKNEGTRWGLIETGDLAAKYFMDAVQLLCSGNEMSEADKKGLRDWFSEYLNWLQDSHRGRELQAQQHNNIRTAYELQCAAYARFIGDHEVAKRLLISFKSTCIDKQIRQDGLMPEELWRTKSMGYSAKNLRLMLQVGQIAQHYEIDIYGHRSPGGVGIRNALEALLPYWKGEQKWAHKQMRAFRRERANHALRWAAHAYAEWNYEAHIPNLQMGTPQAEWSVDLQQLLWALP